MISKKIGIGLAACVSLALYQFLNYDVLQDDAFISFRYVKNFLDGHGLVFNPGERVEGYTNFFWIILLAFLAKLGPSLIETARWTGVLAVVATLGVCAYATQRYYPPRGWLWIISAPFLLAANGALAYWAGSGLETALFTLLAAAGAVAYLSRPALSLFLLALATLTRPEGALLALLFGLVGIILKERSWKATLGFWGGLTLLLVPYAAFKWFYYGSFLPNPFYAKTGFSSEYWKSGLEYGYLFLKQYGVFGLGLLIPLYAWRKLTVFSRFCLLVFIGYGVYIIAIGGDVLKAHRFFVPALIFFYLPLADSLYQLLQKRGNKSPAFALAMVVLCLYSYRFPFLYLTGSAKAERALVAKMSAIGRFFAGNETDKSLAVSTIGALSYYLGERKVIDMLGLTESAVARNPEKIDGLVSTWKERHYNAGYVLSRKPEVILFSTGAKPSSLAERALFLYPDFRQNYRLEFLCREGIFEMYYRRFRDGPARNRPDRPAVFANLLNEGINQLGSREYRKGVDLLRQALATGPPDCAAAWIILGYLFYGAGFPDSAEVYLKAGMELDGGGSVGRYYYRNLLYKQGRFVETAEQDSVLLQMIPSAAQILPRVPTTPYLPAPDQ